MKICFSGLQGSGKTTLVEEIRKLPQFAHYIFHTNVVRNLMKEGIPINELGTEQTQIAVMAKHLQNSIHENAIFDRCSLDCISYTDYLMFDQKILDTQTYLALLNIHAYLMEQYDRIFYLEPEFPVVDDGVRSKDEKFYNAVKTYFEHRIKDRPKVIVLKGSIKERLDILLKNI